jgi:Ca2+-binding RTX toxin-like protein
MEPSGSAGVNMNADASSDPDVDVGSSRYIVISAEGGNDLITGLGGPGFVGPLRGTFALAEGGLGKDLLFAGQDGSAFDGDEGGDKLVGSPHQDVLDGGPGKDKLLAGRGNDFLDALDRKKDRVICGSGKRDRAAVDFGDRIKGCERGRRVRLPTRHLPPKVKPLAAMLP